MNVSEFELGLSEEIDRTFHANPQLTDHRSEFPWWAGSLGNPFAGIWFVAERPSLPRLREVREKHGVTPTAETQWAISKGDDLFRQALFASGFKSGGELTPGGWNCYVTNLVKDCEGSAEFFDRSITWSNVFRWELENSRPRMIVLMGKTKLPKAFFAVKHFLNQETPDPVIVDSYAYVAFHPNRRLGPMHPSRVSDYLQSFDDVRTRFERGREQ